MDKRFNQTGGPLTIHAFRPEDFWISDGVNRGATMFRFEETVLGDCYRTNTAITLVPVLIKMGPFDTAETAELITGRICAPLRFRVHLTFMSSDAKVYRMEYLRFDGGTILTQDLLVPWSETPRDKNLNLIDMRSIHLNEGIRGLFTYNNAMAHHDANAFRDASSGFRTA